MSGDWDLDAEDNDGFGTPVQRGVLGNALFTARQSAGLSQRDLAQRAGVAQTVVSRLERGPRQPSWRLFAQLLDVMEMEASVAVHRRVGSLDAEVDRLRPLSPEQRWADCNLDAAIEALLRAFGSHGWAVDAEAALLGHGVPVQPDCLEVALLNDETTLAALFDAAVGARWIHVAENVRGRLGEIPATTRAQEMREFTTEGWTVLGIPVSLRLVPDLDGTVQLGLRDKWVQVTGLERLHADGAEARRALDRWAIRARLGP